MPRPGIFRLPTIRRRRPATPVVIPLHDTPNNPNFRVRAVTAVPPAHYPTQMREVERIRHSLRLREGEKELIESEPGPLSPADQAFLNTYEADRQRMIFLIHQGYSDD